ncbi:MULTISPECIES: sugar ABC transporter ATP-binding protein [unclassified Rhodococcus (in: high G+C Gram-positive bacteria)]|uniref:sugar ABC transporter ATP-binding protein n=1 Tax=unclassified Rhodococcus (in: high G+C Gram-positive bacteria) TaxID=192944 RepID=UPI0015C5B05C|nr:MULTISPECIES: sugar ABC transporter ATP-binding protein [unclassified Rhodococcus (in: high G+C Gram-positive bacteria)]
MKEAEFDIRFGEVHALLGGNGSGKSTTIKILAGVEPADPGGRISIGGQTLSFDGWKPADAQARRFRFIHQDLGLIPDLTVAENLFLSEGLNARRRIWISWKSLNARAQQVLDRFALPIRPTTPVSELSLIERTLVATARALQDVTDDDRAVLVLDEPTAALPPVEADDVLSAIRGHADHGHAVIIVTHRLGEVVDVADRLTVLRQGRVVASRGLAQSSESDLGALITGVPAAEASSTIVAEFSPTERPRLEIRTVSALGLDSVSLTVEGGEVVGIAEAGGKAGTALNELLFGLRRRDNGTIVLDGTEVDASSPSGAMKLGIAYVPGQRIRDALFSGMSVGENLTMASLGTHSRLGVVRGAAEERAIDKAMTNYSVKPERAAGLDIIRLSGGNQQKVSVARWVTRKPRLLLLEEPTQGVDVGARAEIWAKIGEATAEGTSALVTSADFNELATYCNRVAIFSRGRIQRFLSGADLTVSTLAQAIHDV